MASGSEGSHTHSVIVKDWFCTVETRRGLRLVVGESCERVERRRGMDGCGWHRGGF